MDSQFGAALGLEALVPLPFLLMQLLCAYQSVTGMLVMPIVGQKQPDQFSSYSHCYVETGCVRCTPNISRRGYRAGTFTRL